MRLCDARFRELGHFLKEFLVFFIEVLGFPDVFVSLEKGCELREPGIGVGTVGGAISTALQIGCPEVDRVDGCVELCAGDFEGTGSANLDEID